MKHKPHHTLAFIFIAAMFVATVSVLYYGQVVASIPVFTPVTVHRQKSYIIGFPKLYTNPKYGFQFTYPGGDCTLESSSEFVFVSAKCPVYAEDIAGPAGSSPVAIAGAMVTLQKENDYSFNQSTKDGVKLDLNTQNTNSIYDVKYDCRTDCVIPEQWFIGSSKNKSYYFAVTGDKTIVDQILTTFKFTD